VKLLIVKIVVGLVAIALSAAGFLGGLYDGTSSILLLISGVSVLGMAHDHWCDIKRERAFAELLVKFPSLKAGLR
jgi:hypothetical protein